MASIREELDQKLGRFEELEHLLVQPDVASDSRKAASIAREHGTLAKLATKYRRFKQLTLELAGLASMINSPDPDERSMAEAEQSELRGKREQLWIELLEMTLGGTDANRDRCIMEIRAGTGGDEAALFARNLYEMYRRHADQKGWRVEVMDSSPSELGGFKEISLAFEGEGVYRELGYESGGHRVQRVPETEAKGRIHTSAATVAVMPEPEDVEVDLKPDDYRKDVYCASGPGGQHVNKTASAIRLSHYATGIVVAMQDERSQHKNLAKAMRVLKTRLYEHYQRQEHEKRSKERKTLIGSGDRSERIRTYNFPDNRVTDHRINLTIHKLDQILAGNLQPITDALIEYDRNTLRSDMEESE